jgi:L-ascorbate metabolism protein UlaG (beta-lactamase superfamily)
LSRGVSGRTKFAIEIIRQSLCEPITGVPQKPLLTRPGEMGITFIGHSSFLIQLGGKNILVDPVFATWLIVLRRLRRPGVRIHDLPPIDLVLQTHAHMDHLNLPSLRAILRQTMHISGRTPAILVPRGVEDLVETLGFANVTALQWGETTHLDAVSITMTAAQHWGTRMFNDHHRGYGGYVLQSGGQSVYHSGDTAYFSGFHEIAKLEPRIALLPIGAYSPDSFRSVHTTPEDALQAFLDVGAERMVPMHYGTFRLSKEPIDEPLARLLAAAKRSGIADRVAPLQEGETLLIPSAGRQRPMPSAGSIAARR